MWRSSKRLLANCAQFLVRCGRRNDIDIDDLDDISEEDVQDVPDYFRPDTFAVPLRSRQEDVQHRPDAPCIKRCSPPEVISKMRQALEEMGQTENQSIPDNAHNDTPVPFDSTYYHNIEQMN